MTKNIAIRRLDPEFYIGAAKQHGEDSAPDHEVGDLQDMFRAVWDLLTLDQKIEFAQLDATSDVLENAVMDEDLLEACTDELEKFVEETRIGGPDMAHKFMSELEESVETLGGIVDTHDAATLVDLMYLSQAIAKNTFIEVGSGSGVLDLLKALPSCEDWMRFVDVAEDDETDSATEHCVKCNNPLEPSQIGKCDSCQEIDKTTWTNHYICPCGEEWEDTHDCCCNDRCPKCRREIEPYISDDGSVPDEKIDAARSETLERHGLFECAECNHLFLKGGGSLSHDGKDYCVECATRLK